MRRMLLVWLVTLLLACGGEAEIGEACETAGSLEECSGDGICSNESDGSVCRKICSADTDCTSDENCNGVAGTNLKSCQPK